MKKLLNKCSDKLGKVSDKLKRKPDVSAPVRITNDTVVEHREKILADARKFKYPFQYSKHKILIGAAAVLVLAASLFGTYTGVMLYKVQTTDDFYYNVAKFLSLPVANVDGKDVGYDDYLRRIRSTIYYKQNQEEIDFSNKDNQDELNYLKREELSRVEKFAYASKIAKEKGISVTDEEVDKELNKNLQTSNGAKMSPEDYEQNVLYKYFGWSIGEYKEELRNRLLEQKVEFAVDNNAKDKINKAKDRLDGGEEFATVAIEMSDDDTSKDNGGAVSASTGDVDSSGIIAVARSLEEGEVSDIIQGVDGYYIVKLGSKTDSTTNFSLIKVGLNQFTKNFDELKTAGKIKEFIVIPDSSSK